jgi:hypothetical protein
MAAIEKVALTCDISRTLEAIMEITLLLEGRMDACVGFHVRLLARSPRACVLDGALV